MRGGWVAREVGFVVVVVLGSVVCGVWVLCGVGRCPGRYLLRERGSAIGGGEKGRAGVLELTAILDGRVVGRCELVGQERVRVGRSRENELVIPVASVSRWHAEVVLRGTDEAGCERWVVRDVGSRHGVWAMGMLVHEAEVAAGDAVMLGPVRLEAADLGARIGQELSGWLDGSGVVGSGREVSVAGSGGPIEADLDPGLSATGAMVIGRGRGASAA